MSGSTGKTHIRGLIFPSHELFLESSDGIGRAWNRMFGSAATGPVSSSAERRTKTAFINLIARCSDARKSKHVTTLRANMTVTHSLIASPLLSCDNKSMQSSRQLCRFYSINRMEFPVHPALYWQRSRLVEINSRTREYYHLNLSPSTRGRALIHH
jgi:hypothetical protein